MRAGSGRELLQPYTVRSRALERIQSRALGELECTATLTSWRRGLHFSQHITVFLRAPPRSSPTPAMTGVPRRAACRARVLCQPPRGQGARPAAAPPGRGDQRVRAGPHGGHPRPDVGPGWRRRRRRAAAVRGRRGRLRAGERAAGGAGERHAGGEGRDSLLLVWLIATDGYQQLHEERRAHYVCVPLGSELVYLHKCVAACPLTPPVPV